MYLIVIVIIMFLLLGGNFIYYLISTIFSTIFWTFAQIWKHYNVDNPMRKSGFLEKKELEEKILLLDRDQKYQDQITQEQNKIITAVLRKTRQLRVKYLYCDEILFQYLLKNYSIMSVDEIEELENMMVNNHRKNLLNRR